MSIKEKTRILTTLGVQGELQINHLKFPFGCIWSSREREAGRGACVMISHRHRQFDYTSYLRPQKSHLQIWQVGYCGSLIQRVKWSDVTILWHMSPGIADERIDLESLYGKRDRHIENHIDLEQLTAAA